MNRYVIKHEENGLYYSIHMGWVTLNLADIFDKTDTAIMILPEFGMWQIFHPNLSASVLDA